MIAYAWTRTSTAIVGCVDDVLLERVFFYTLGLACSKRSSHVFANDGVLLG